MLSTPMHDKSQVLSQLGQRGPVSIELGCGPTKRDPSSIGIDALDLPGVDIVGDVFEVLAAFPQATVDSASSYHFFEHIDDLSRMMQELARVLRPGGTLHVVVPHFSNPYFYSDYTHRRFFGLYTFCYLTNSSLFRRPVPRYGIEPAFDLQDVRLVFRSTRPFYVRHAIKRAVGFLFNATNYLKEFYEENLCYFFPCYEVTYRTKRR